jgi:hypothetical protein
MDYDGNLVQCHLAQMRIQTNALHHNFIWKLELLQIISSIKRLESHNNKELVVFQNNLSKKMII